MLREDLKHITITNLLGNRKISVRTSNCCFNAKFDSLFDIIDYYESGNSFFNIRNAGRRTCLELQSLCDEYIPKIGKTIDVENGISDEEKLLQREVEIKNLIETDLLDAINKKLIDVYDVFSYLNPNQEEILKEIYTKQIENCSNRTKNRIRAIGFENFAIDYLFAPDNVLLKINGLGKSSFEEALDLKNRMRNEFVKYIHLSEEDLSRINLIREKGEIMQDDFVFDFFTQNDHFPMFWIAEQKLNHNLSREADILKRTFNTYQNQQLLSLKELAQEYGTTRERFRQIRSVFNTSYSTYTNKRLKGKNKEKDKFNTKYVFELLEIQIDRDWDYYKSLLENFDTFWQEDNLMQELLKQEKCSFSSKFILQLLSMVCNDTHALLGGFEVIEKKDFWRNAVLIKKYYFDIFDFEKFVIEFRNHFDNNDKEYDLNIENYLSNSSCWASVIDLSKFDNILSIVKDILLYEFHLYSNSDGLIPIPATKERNISDIIYDILQQKGNPMHLNEIFEEFKKFLPEHKYSESAQLRPYLYKDERISHRNRSSTYTLKEWKHIRTGTIRDAIVEFLDENDLPRIADDITEYVLQYFPKTNISSVRTSMFNDTKKRFSFFNNNLFGLSSKQYPSKYEEAELQEGQRKSFEERIYNFEKFLSENDHFPFSTSENENEASLYRWWKIINKNTEKLTGQQKKDVERIIKQYADFETDKAVYDWFLHFNEFKLFALENRRPPLARGDEKFLYGWLRRAKKDFLDGRLNEKQRTKYVEFFKLL